MLTIPPTRTITQKNKNTDEKPECMSKIHHIYRPNYISLFSADLVNYHMPINRWRGLQDTQSIKRRKIDYHHWNQQKNSPKLPCGIVRESKMNGWNVDEKVEMDNNCVYEDGIH
jgi:hypothetical protein